MSFDIQNKKIELIQWLTTIDDNNIIQKILDLRNNESKDWWNEISDKEKVSISKGLADVEKGNTKPHSEVKKIYVKWL